MTLDRVPFFQWLEVILPFGTHMKKITLPLLALELMASAGVATAQTTPGSSADAADDLTEVTVTGSRIRGHQSAAAQVYTITSKDIEEQGLLSTDDIFRSIPQVSGSGSAANMYNNPLVPGGAVGASTVNLGGFGAKSTLVLVNGRRTASSSILFGDSVNLSAIPMSAIERVEVLPAAASAIYGADAVAGVVNIILKKSSAFEANTRVSYEGGSNGGDAPQVSQDLSFGWDSGRFTGVASYKKTDPVTSREAGFTTQDFRGRGGFDLRTNGFAATGNIAGLGTLPASNPGTSFAPGDVSPTNFAPVSNIQEYLTPESETTSVYLNAEQQVGASVRLFVDALYSWNDTTNLENPYNVYGAQVPATNPFNPFGTTVSVTYQFDTERDLGLMPSTFRDADQELIQGTFGAEISLPHDWRLQVYGTQADEKTLHGYKFLSASDPAMIAALADTNPQTALNLFGNGTAQNTTTLNSLVTGWWQGRRHNKITSDMTAYSAQADGTLFELPTGAVKASFVVERRKESLDWAGFGVDQPKGERTTDSVGGEFSVPLLSSASSQSLDLSLAARWDRNNGKGDFDYDGIEDHMKEFSATSPMVGLAWKPIRDLRLRASWNKAFRAPVVHDLTGLNYPYTTTVLDPLAPGGPRNVVVDVSYAPSKDLGPESAKIWTAGVDWQHLDASGAGLTTSLTYSNTDFKDRITGVYTYFNQDAAFLVSHPEVFPGATIRDASGNLTDVLLRNINIAGQKAEVWNLDASYAFLLQGQRLTIGTGLSYTSEFLEQVNPSLPEKELAGTYLGPDRLRATFRAGWNSADLVWGANLFVRTSSSYHNDIATSAILNPPAGSGSSIREEVSGYTTVDLTASYQYRGGAVWYDGLSVTGGVRNLFDKDFPFIDNAVGRISSFDPSRVDIRGRVMFIEVGKKF